MERKLWAGNLLADFDFTLEPRAPLVLPEHPAPGSTSPPWGRHPCLITILPDQPLLKRSSLLWLSPGEIEDSLKRGSRENVDLPGSRSGLYVRMRWFGL